MAVINLEDGAVLQESPDIAQNIDVAPVEKQSGIINLETGRFVSEQPIETIDQPKTEDGMFEFFTGTAREKATPELAKLPEFGTTPEGDTFRISLGLLSTFDEKAQQDIIQQAIPEAVFEKTQDGSIIIEVPTPEGGTRRSVLNKPGFSAQDVTTATAQVLSFIPAAKLASLGKTLLQKVGIGAMAAAGTEQALQEGGVALGREERDPAATAIAGSLGGVAEVVVPAIQAVRGARQAKATGIEQEAIDQAAVNVPAAREASKQTGIPLFKAQQTAIPETLEKQAFVAQLPAGTKSAIDGLRKQNKSASDAVEDFLKQISPDESVPIAADGIRTSSKRAISKLKAIREEKASPIYKQAFSEKPKVDIKPVVGLIDNKLNNLPESGEISNSLKRIMKFISPSAKQADTGPSLEKLHNAKIEIDQMIEKTGEGSLGNTTKSQLLEVQKLLLKQMDKASGTYKDARKAFELASPAVEKLENSVLGKIANLNDDQLKQVTTKIFDPANTPENIIQMRKIISDVDPGAWDAIVRRELEQRLGSIKTIAEEGTVENIPGQLFRAIFPNDKKSKVLFNALDGDAKRNLKYLQTALSRARLGRPGGSQTAGREEIKRELRGGIYQTLRNLFRSPINTITSAGEDAAFNSRAATLAKSLYDPTWKAEMREIRKLSPKSPAAGRALTQLLNDIEMFTQDENQ